MASKKKVASKRSTAKQQKPSLSPAAASGDPTVHQLLAERQTAVMNQELLTIDQIDKQLAGMGFYA